MGEVLKIRISGGLQKVRICAVVCLSVILGNTRYIFLMSLCYSHYVEMLFGSFKIRQTKNQTHRTLTIIYLPRQPVGRLYPFQVLRKGVVLMYVTYSDLFAFVMMITGIVALIYQIHKK